MKMKKALLCLVLMALSVLCAACASQDKTTAAAGTADSVPVTINQAEYVLYQNIFYNDYGKTYDGSKVEKTGVFSTIRDMYSNRTRYYVWGVLDNTKCCDWQWEFVPASGVELPPDGSLVKVSGVFASSVGALDGYWIDQAKVETMTTYTGATAELDMCAMSDTLERVQLLNILYAGDKFEGQSFAAYGRIDSAGQLQDPYYDGSWSVPFNYEGSLPAIGTDVELRGTVKGGVLSDCKISVRTE